MTNATLESDRGFDDDGRPVLPVNDLLQSAIYTLTGIVLFAVLLFNHTHIETRDQVKLFGGLELFVRLVASGAAGILGLYGFVFVPKVRLAFISFPGAWVLGSMAFIVLGTICSPEPRTSLPYLLTLISVVLFSPMAFYVVGTKRFINIVLISMTITLLGSWFLYLFMPEYGVVQEHISKTETVARFGGTSHPNTLAGVVVLMIAILAYLYFEGKKSLAFCLPLFVLCVVTLFLSGTRVAAVSCALSILFVYQRFWLRTDILPITAALIVTVLIAALMLFSTEGENPISSLLGSATRSGNIEEITSVTGRSTIWAFSLEKIGERPLVGYGPGLAKYYFEEKGLLLHTHNAVLNVAFAGGIFAGACGLMMFVHQLLISIGGRYRLAALISLIIILNSLTEVPIFDYIPGTPTVVWLAAVFWPVLDDGSL